MEPKVKALPVEGILTAPVPAPHFLKGEIRRVEKLSLFEITRMHLLFGQYYENHPLEQFQKDLMEKNHVILLRDRRDRSIQGFSTLLKVKISTPRGTVAGIYSGDTVVAKEYWGSSALGLTFLKYLWLEKIKNPMEPLFWFLISKGYKTYLLMANNFAVHFPRTEMKTPEYYQQIMDQFYFRKFGSWYKKELGLIIPEGPSCHLKEEVAPITPKLLQIPRVAFFQKQNPQWKDGVELACLAEMTLLMPLKYAVKKFIKGLIK